MGAWLTCPLLIGHPVLRRGRSGAVRRGPPARTRAVSGRGVRPAATTRPDRTRRRRPGPQWAAPHYRHGPVAGPRRGRGAGEDFDAV